MTAVGLQLAQTSMPRLQSRSFFETFLRALITLSAGTAVVLSSISVCDGHWLFSPGQQLFGVWGTCEKDALCSPELRRISGAMVVVRSGVSLAVVLAIFGLELLMVSQLCDDGHSRRKWCMGSVLLLVSFLLSSAGTLTYVFLLRAVLVHSAFTLTFWCQLLGTFLFFLNGVSGLYCDLLSGRDCGLYCDLLSGRDCGLLRTQWTPALAEPD
ncbi:voltage-dependent calcium channel gamma-like subunit isoform X2 [Ranitomeya variabilis]|uniref:voltage-dependent calcium channel gamma-like subunit isoform X2 n=1 Tax=Ranitomeya variabilis TaxID=490064 RepID=UPI0040572546